VRITLRGNLDIRASQLIEIFYFGRRNYLKGISGEKRLLA
jgi:hypothetical protein